MVEVPDGIANETVSATREVVPLALAMYEVGFEPCSSCAPHA